MRLYLTYRLTRALLDAAQSHARLRLLGLRGRTGGFNVGCC